jgi:signal transduction histidine kinase
VILIKNGLEAMEEAAASSKILRLRSRYVPSGGISLFVEDSGKGLPKEALPVLGDLSFSTKAQGSGIGLGLVRGIVEAHGGEIRLHANDWGGATIEVYLPTKKPSSGT